LKRRGEFREPDKETESSVSAISVAESEAGLASKLEKFEIDPKVSENKQLR
jgi:hypothetical protein